VIECENPIEKRDDQVEQIKNLALKRGWRLLVVIQSNQDAIETGMPSYTSQAWEMQTREFSWATCARCVGLAVFSFHCLVLLPIAECVNCYTKSTESSSMYAVCKQGIIVVRFLPDGNVDNGMGGQRMQYRAWSEMGSIDISPREVVMISDQCF
jgi:hypothetical protein